MPKGRYQKILNNFRDQARAYYEHKHLAYDPLGLGDSQTQLPTPPPEVSLLEESRIFSLLPVSGGLLQQPATTMELMAVASAIESEILKLAEKNKESHDGD